MSAVPVPSRRPRSLGPKTREKFLAALEEGWSIANAAKRCGHDRRRLYELRCVDDDFAAAWDRAVEKGTEVLEDELRRRAYEGWTEDTFDGKGNLIRRVQRRAAQDLHLLLKARRPDVYRDNARVEVTGAGGGPVELSADYTPTSLLDVFRLAGELGIKPDAIDGEAVEVSAELEAAS